MFNFGWLKLSWRQATTVGVLLICLGCQQNIQAESPAAKKSAIATMYRRYAREFPQVPSITVEELQQWQQQEKKIILVDVRTLKERRVSIIPGAIAREAFERDLSKYQRENSTIVAYCTIGYRSGKYAAKLRQQRIEIFNLEGSLLAWSHVGGNLVDRQGKTNRVHVFGRQWQLTADNYQPVW